MAALADSATPAPGGGAVKCWRTDATKAKDKWQEVKVTQAKKDADTFPFPMAVSHTIQRPDSAKTWEVWELKVKLVLAAKVAPGAEPDLRVEAATDGVLPQEVAVAIQATILARWNKERRRAAKAAAKAAAAEATPAQPYCFAFVEIFTWCEENYIEILSVLPPFVNRFITEGTHGNEWHYCILEPKIPPPSVAPLTPEEEEAAAEAEAKRVEEQLDQMRLLEIARKEYAEERRAAAELEGPKARQLSKKELDEAKKDKQGSRLSKTGSRRTKHDAEAEAQGEKEEAKKKAEKKKAREDAAKAGGAVV